MSAKALAAALAGNSARLVTSLIRAATHPFKIINAIRARFKGMNMQEVSQVYWEGWASWNAAQDLMISQQNQPPPLDTIPVNANLNASQQAPDRFRYNLESTYQIPGEAFTRKRDISFTSPNELSVAELQAAYEADLGELQGRYPTSGWGAATPGALQIGFTLLSVERKF